MALAGFLGPLVILGFFNTIGLGLPVVSGPAAGLVLAIGMVVVTRQELTDRAKKSAPSSAGRSRSTSIWLPCRCRRAEATPKHCLPPRPSAQGGPSPICRTPSTAPVSPESPPWHALGQLGDRFGIRELTDLDAALTLANEDGAKVRATLVARAETLRSERIADAEAAAAQATESMRFALIVMVFAFLSYELYPSVARLFAG